jgi:hypothetical protein
MKRIYHTWDKWECYPAGFYEDTDAAGRSVTECQKAYADFLRDKKAFAAALARVITEWPNSCEHYLSNENMNRIAWLGQSSACLATGLPACYRTGYHLLNEQEKLEADLLALEYLNKWLSARGEATISPAEAKSKTIPNLY